MNRRMQSSTRRTYLESKVMTATPEQLQLMLYDAAIRFAQQCRQAIVQRDFEKAQTSYERADAVLCELLRGLRPDVDREITESYASLYRFCQLRLDEAKLRHSVSLAADAIAILEHVRESWVLLMDTLSREDESREPSFEEAALAVEA